MDKTELYIKMCEKATEIQERREKLRLGDFVWRGRKYLYEVCVCEDVFRYKEDMIWLPRQDQLQDMTGDYKHFPMPLHYKFSEFIKWIEQEEYDHQKESDEKVDKLYPFTSLEQYWLALIMKEKYNKIWNGKDWIPDRLYCNKHKHYLDETNDVCPECEGEAEQDADAAEWEAEQMARADDEARDAEDAAREAEQGGEEY